MGSIALVALPHLLFDVNLGVGRSRQHSQNGKRRTVLQRKKSTDLLHGFQMGMEPTGILKSFKSHLDARTGMQYLFGYVAVPPHFHRVWLPTFDKEFVALDISFPPKVGHDWQKPLYLVLHGLNGGSKEWYVIDFCHERNKEGSTLVVLIARGLEDTPIQGWAVSGF
jgi:predicted alpha/beta-fold hydrolase